MLSKKAGEITNTRNFVVSFYALKHLELQSFDLKTTITHNNFRHCRVRSSSFARQPFLKQLYMLVLVHLASFAVRALLSPVIINLYSTASF